MIKKLLSTTSLLVALTISTSIFSGCGSTKQNTKPTVATAETKAPDKFSYPMKSSATLKFWSDLNGSVSPNYKNLGDTPFAKELEKNTGIKVEYLHPAAGMAKEAFGLLVASGDLPDLIEYNWTRNFPGGPELAISNKIILKLNDTIGSYAPNLQKYLKANPNIDKMIKTDSSSYYVFPFIRGDDMLLTTYGLTIRADWLKELGLQSPTTMDEWYTVLKAFKEKKNAASPFGYAGAGNTLEPFNFSVFIGAYGINKGFFQDNGVMKYGPMQPGYKDFLATMAKWYKEGLIDKNFATSDMKALDANVLNGQTGAIPMYPGGGIGKYVPALKQKDPNANLVPVVFPSLKKGDVPKFSSRTNPFDGNGSVAISATTKNLEVATRFLDYAYGGEGNLLHNFGIEGKSYNMENGIPKMTDEVLKNPDKLSIVQAWAKYGKAVYQGSFIQRKEYIEQYYTLQEQKDALRLWNQTDAVKNILPPLTQSTEESAQYSKIFSDVNTYLEEFTLKVIMGTESIENFDKFVEQLKKLGIEKAVTIQQAAFERYSKR